MVTPTVGLDELSQSLCSIPGVCIIFVELFSMLFYVFLVTFCSLLVFYFALCSSFILLDIKPSG